MVNGKVVAGIVISVLILAGVYFLVSVGTVQQSGNTVKVVGTGSSVNEDAKVIEITAEGFSPSLLNIRAGNTVTFINKDSKAHWPASASHPTHTAYPGADYDAEGSYQGSLACVSEGVAKEGAFDPCKAIEPGESWSFTFFEVGSWNYHDHINAGLYGKIVVE
ncbi:MAG: hypothetical protein WD876_02465 [Candidatus Pacearchaeota archaeon]